MDHPDAAHLTRSQIIEVMRACNLADLSEEAIDSCVAEAIAVRNRAATTTTTTTTSRAVAGVAPASGAAGGGVSYREQQQHGRSSAARESAPALLRESDDEYDGYNEVRRTANVYQTQTYRSTKQDHQQPPTARATDVSPFSNEPAPPAPQSARRTKQAQANADRMHPRHPTRSHQHRFERTSISSVRGTPVVGRPGTTPTARALPGGGGAAAAMHADPSVERPAVRSGAHPAQKAGTAGRQAVPSRGRVAGIPGYMSSAYAEHLLQRAAGELDAEHEAAYDAEDHHHDDERPATTAGPRHQRRFEPFVSASTRARQMREEPDENIAPPTARAHADKAAADESKAGGSRAHDRSSAMDSATGRRRSASVGTSILANAVEANITGVIYAPLGSKTYLAGGFRSRSQRAPVASPRMGPPRKASDPVRRYQQMKEYWDHDHFLRMQRPDGQRRKLRWAVRASMNEWHPDPDHHSGAVQHNSLAY